MCVHRSRYKIRSVALFQHASGPVRLNQYCQLFVFGRNMHSALSIVLVMTQQPPGHAHAGTFVKEIHILFLLLVSFVSFAKDAKSAGAVNTLVDGQITVYVVTKRHKTTRVCAQQHAPRLSPDTFTLSTCCQLCAHVHCFVRLTNVHDALE